MGLNKVAVIQNIIFAYILAIQSVSVSEQVCTLKKS